MKYDWSLEMDPYLWLVELWFSAEMNQR